MRSKLLALLLFLFSACPKHGDGPGPNPEPTPMPPYEWHNAGIAWYGLFSARWPGNDALASIGPLNKIRISTVWHVFGESTGFLTTLFNDPRMNLLEVTLWSEVCQRNENCTPNDVVYGISPENFQKKIKARDGFWLNKLSNYARHADQILRPFWDKRPDVMCIISPGLESNLDAQAGKILIDTLKPLFPSRCQWAWQGGGNIAGTLKESHHSGTTDNPPCLSNLDGEAINFRNHPTWWSPKIDESKIPDYFFRHGGCAGTFLWVPEFNGRGPGPRQDPLNRTHWPSLGLFNDVVRVMKK